MRPSFADDELLELLLREERRRSTPSRSTRAARCWRRSVFGFGPTLLLVGLFIWFLRRAARGAGGGAHRPRPLEGQALRRLRRSARRSTTSPASTRPRRSSSRSSTSSRTPTATAGSAPRSPRACCCPARPAPARRCSRAPSPARPTCRSSRLARRSSSRWSSASARARVRDLFEQAKKAAPAIIFIDELDAIGRARGGGGGGFGGHDEREQTLNQILTEMDGFTGSEGVIVLAATNRPEILDPALLRPGRFDRRVTVNPPDKDGRHEILEVHTRSVPLADDVDLDAIAATTPGMVGADLRNLVNEAALMAARRDHDEGHARRLHRRARADHPRRRAPDHAVAGGARADRLPRVRPRGARHARARRRPGAQGLDRPARARARRHVPVARRPTATATTRATCAGRIVGALGGRAAEEIVYGNVTTGAESDLEQVTQHRAPDGRPLGHVGRDRPRVGAPGARATRRSSSPADRRRPPRRRASWSTARCAASSTSATSARVGTLRENRDQLESLTQALLEQRDARRGRRLPRRGLRAAPARRRPARGAIEPTLARDEKSARARDQPLAPCAAVEPDRQVRASTTCRARRTRSNRSRTASTWPTSPAEVQPKKPVHDCHDGSSRGGDPGRLSADVRQRDSVEHLGDRHARRTRR